MQNHIKFVLFLLLFIITCPHALLSQNKYNFIQFRDETVDFIRQPVKWDGNDWLKLGLVGAGPLLAMQADQPIRDEMMKDRSYYKNTIVEFGRLWGETYSTAILAGAFGLHGFLVDNRSTKKVGFEIIQAALYSGGVTSVLKYAFGRARPFMNRGSSLYEPFTLLDDGLHSFPSGHTTLAFALSTVLSRNAQSNALKILAYVPAALTIFSRVYQDYHWTSDCLFSAVVGYVVATWIVDIHDQKESPLQISSVYPLTIRININ
jgi:membrane-associated phospholipid phosphatase